jgi:hypothetical protein
VEAGADVVAIASESRKNPAELSSDPDIKESLQNRGS